MFEYPSVIKNDIYDIMAEHELGFDVYDESLCDEIIDFLEYKNVSYQYDVIDHMDNFGATVCFAFLDDNKPILLTYEYRQEG